MTLEDKLFLVAFNVDKEPHLKLKDKAVCAACKAKPCLYICPVENYTLQGEEVVLSWEGCLECGTCRIVCPHDAIDWKYPLGGYGVNFRNG
ncbi:MAG: 4Fe-4S dicluster domain-containing protein [Firmicutes bacterium]|nr:4Fe-4S dicluster domain-containing protein [Bacillota bacterium]